MGDFREVKVFDPITLSPIVIHVMYTCACMFLAGKYMYTSAVLYICN